MISRNVFIHLTLYSSLILHICNLKNKVPLWFQLSSLCDLDLEIESCDSVMYWLGVLWARLDATSVTIYEKQNDGES